MRFAEYLENRDPELLEAIKGRLFPPAPSAPSFTKDPMGAMGWQAKQIGQAAMSPITGPAKMIGTAMAGGKMAQIQKHYEEEGKSAQTDQEKNQAVANCIADGGDQNSCKNWIYAAGQANAFSARGI